MILYSKNCRPGKGSAVLVLSKTDNHQLSWWTKKLKLWRKKALDAKIGIRSANRTQEKQGGNPRMDKNSLAHTSWNCKYHIVFAPKYRRQVIYGELRREIGQILRKLCQQKGIEIHEANACTDHIHMLISIPPKISVAYAVGYLKGKSSLMIFDRHANLKYKYGNRHFWCRGYYVDTVGRNKEAIAKYIRNQLQEDVMQDQISIKELIDPFTGEPVKEGKR